MGTGSERSTPLMTSRNATCWENVDARGMAANPGLGSGLGLPGSVFLARPSPRSALLLPNPGVRISLWVLSPRRFPSRIPSPRFLPPLPGRGCLTAFQRVIVGLFWWSVAVSRGCRRSGEGGCVVLLSASRYWSHVLAEWSRIVPNSWAVNVRFGSV